jgi:hypothetical protein
LAIVFKVTTKRGRYPHTDDGVEVRRIFHELRSAAIENLSEQFKGIFDSHGQVPTKGWSTPAGLPWGLSSSTNWRCDIGMNMTRNSASACSAERGQEQLLNIIRHRHARPATARVRSAAWR